MKRNINLMQNGIDIENDSLNELQKEYILQALANLGQRIGIKGDGISYRNFSFLDLLNNENISYNANEHIGWLKYQDLGDNELVATFGITNIDSGEETLLSNINTKDINDILYASNEIQFTIPINNIEKYSKNSIISNDGNILTIITVGKILGYEDVDENNGVLLYYKFDVKTNKPIYIAKIGYVSSDNSSNYYYALELDRAKDNEGVYINNEYELTIKLFDSKLLGIYTDTFNNLFMYSAHNNGEDLGFAFLRKDFLDLEKFKAYNNDLNNNYDSNSPLSVIMNNISNNNYYASTKLTLYLNTEANEFLYSDKDELRDTISLYKNEYNFIDIEEELYNINNDITDFYRNSLIYYNDKFFIENRSQFIKRILCKLYETIVDESESLNISNTKNYYKMYIPFNYELSYVCNSNNELNIYWSNDIYVLLANLTNNSSKKDILHKDNYLIFDYDEIDKVQSYRFEIDYNKKYEDIINSVNVRKIYSMPFVDADETWNINGSSTSIRAIGKDAGNPNIIIIYSKTKEYKNDSIDSVDSYEIINTVANKDFSSEEFIREQFEIDKSLFANISTDKVYCYAWLPKITNINKELFDNSIILNICDLDCLESSLIKDYYLGSNILTIWYYTIENNTYKFKLIEKDGKAMPLGVTENLESIINSTTLLNLNEQELLILKAEIESLGQELLTGSNKRWGIIKNKKGSDYNKNYNNNLNTIIQYTNNLEYEVSDTKNSVKYDENLTDKFINSVADLGRTNVTNVLYPKYITEEVEEEIQTEVQVNELINKLQSEEQITIEINGDKFKVNDQIKDVIKQVIETKLETQSIKVSTKVLKKDTDNSYYNEYIFNDNIPTIDFKEIFIRNINTLNKYNVLSLDEEGHTYYGYLGSSYDETNKSTLHLGTLNKNINIGTDTLVNDIDIDTFKKYDKLSLDFDHILLNSSKTLETSSYPYTTKKIINDDGITYDEYKVGKYWILDKLYNNEFTYNINNDDIINNIFDDLTSETINVYEYIYDDFFETNNQYNDIILNNPIINFKDVRDENNTINYYFICINYIIQNIFNINLKDKYKNGKIIIYFGSNKLLIIKNPIERKIPLFFLKVNDPLIIKQQNNVIWSTDTIDILLNETTIKNNEETQNVISIMTKFDKYNLIGTDRYVIWDYNYTNGDFEYQIKPDQNWIATNIEILNIRAESIDDNGNEITYNEIDQNRNIPITISYEYRLIYTSNGNIKYGNSIHNKIKISETLKTEYIETVIDSNNVQLSNTTLIIPIDIPIEPIEIIDPETELSITQNVNSCKVRIFYQRYSANLGEEIISSICQPTVLNPDNMDHTIIVRDTYNINYEYIPFIQNYLTPEWLINNPNIKNSINTTITTTNYEYIVTADNASTVNDKIVLIGGDTKTWTYFTNKNGNIFEKDITVSTHSITIRKKSGYYIYWGSIMPTIDTNPEDELSYIIPGSEQYGNSYTPGWYCTGIEDLSTYALVNNQVVNAWESPTFEDSYTWLGEEVPAQYLILPKHTKASTKNTEFEQLPSITYKQDIVIKNMNYTIYDISQGPTEHVKNNLKFYLVYDPD